MNDYELLKAIHKGSRLESLNFPPLRWAIPGILPEGFGLFTGAPKLGKSWFTLDLALSLARGDEVLGCIDLDEARPVLLLALEDGERRLKDRSKKLLPEGVSIPDMFHYATMIKQGQVIDTIRAWLKEHGDSAPVVILDTLGKASVGGKTTSNNAFEKDYANGSALKALVDQWPGACLIAVHHVRKAASEDWMESTSGSNGLNGSADWTATITRNRGDDRAVFRVTGRDVVEQELALVSDKGKWRLDGDSISDAISAADKLKTPPLGENMQTVLDYVNSHGRAVRAEVIAEATNVNQATVRQCLSRLTKTGRIRKLSAGLYLRIDSVTSVTSVTDQVKAQVGGLQVVDKNVTQPLTPVSQVSQALDGGALGTDSNGLFGAVNGGE